MPSPIQWKKRTQNRHMTRTSENGAPTSHKVPRLETADEIEAWIRARKARWPSNACQGKTVGHEIDNDVVKMPISKNQRTDSSLVSGTAPDKPQDVQHADIVLSALAATDLAEAMTSASGKETNELDNTPDQLYMQAENTKLDRQTPLETSENELGKNLLAGSIETDDPRVASQGISNGPSPTNTAPRSILPQKIQRVQKGNSHSNDSYKWRKRRSLISRLTEDNTESLSDSI